MRRITHRRRSVMFLAFGALALGACSVPEKQQAAPDAGVDAPPAPPPPDSDAPDTTIDQAPDMLSSKDNVRFEFSSNDPGASFMCRIDMEAPQPCKSPYERAHVPDGPHSFSVRAVDAAGNSDDTPAERVWSIDTVAPDTMLVTGPPAADNSVTAVFTFRSGEANVTFECSLDSAGFLPCVSGASFGPVGDGAHSFSVRARDRTGNVDSSAAVYAWAVDTSTPDTQILISPPDATASTGASFEFFSPDAGGGATFQCSLDGAGFTACTSPRAYASLTEGAHTFAVRVRDAVGNFDPTPATRNWVVDLTPPNTTITAGPTGLVAVASASFTFTANEANARFECSRDNGPFAACMSPVPLTALGQGPHTFAVQAIDAVGHVDQTPATQSWTVDTIAPDIVITDPMAASTGGPRVKFTFTVNEGAFGCSFDGGAFAACATSIRANLPAGAHQFAVRATDAAGNVTTVTRAWSVACSAPGITDAAGLLHLDDTGQTLANAVTPGAPATLGDTAMIEPIDPAPASGGRFGGALVFAVADADRVAWPLALAAMPDLTIELWSKPGSSPGARDIAVSGDGRVALRVTAASPTTVQFSIAIAEGGMMGMTVVATSAAVAAGAWHHVIASLQQPALRLWVDGTRTEAGGVQLAMPLALDALRLGGMGAAAYDGALDEVWVAQTAITADEAARTLYCPL
jgi:large repetitive protein